MLSSIQVIQI